jgi:hypothetical protein
VNTNAAQLDLFRQPHMAKRAFDAQRLAGMALGIWRASGPVVGPGAKFFEMRRLAVPGPDVVRFHASLKFNDVRAPGLILLARDRRTYEVCGAMRVYLGEFGWVIAKRPLGRIAGATLNRAPRPP